MAKFLKIHHMNADGEIEKYTVNLEMLVDVDWQTREIDVAAGLTFNIDRDDEWDKIMSFVKENQV